jgi:hypothetical protein
MTNKPLISIIMLTDDKYEVCRRTISYLLAQTVVDRIEFVLVGPSRDIMEVDEAELAPFHSFRIVEIGEVLSTGHGLEAAVPVCSAELVAYAEEHGFPPPNLCEVLIRVAAETNYQAYGWSMLPSNPGWVSWAHIYGQFAEVVAPRPSGEVSRTGGHHTMYRRSLLMEYQGRLVDLFGHEAVLQEDLERRGIKLYLIGEVSSGHTQISSFWSYLHHEFVSQRGFAVARVRNLKWGWGRRLLYAAGSPLIPFLRVKRSLPFIRSTGRWNELMPQIGLIMLAANSAGALGEALGYLTGHSDKAMSARAKIELDRYSHVRDADRDHRLTRSPGAKAETARKEA